MKRTGHMVRRMKDEMLPKGTETKRQEVCRRQTYERQKKMKNGRKVRNRERWKKIAMSADQQNDD